MIDEACSIILNAVSAILFCLLSKHGLISTTSKQHVLLSTNKLFNDLKINSISSDDRFMFCGSMGLNNDLKKIMIKNNLREGANNNPAEFVLEKAFVD